MSSVLSEFPEPDYDQGERIGTVLENKGGNQLVVEYADPNGSSVLTQVQCRLPSKFLHKIWIKRGDYVIIDSNDPTVLSALYPKQILHIQERDLWPAVFPTPKEKSETTQLNPEDTDTDTDTNSNSDSDGLFRNTNRRAPEELSTSDDDDESEEGD